MKNQHVLITGGGIGGLTAALCLAKQGHRIDLFEQAASFEEIGAGIQLSPNASPRDHVSYITNRQLTDTKRKRLLLMLYGDTLLH